MSHIFGTESQIVYCVWVETINSMFEELWAEINDAPGEIFDIPEMKEFTEDKEEESFDKMLESSVEF